MFHELPDKYEVQAAWLQWQHIQMIKFFPHHSLHEERVAVLRCGCKYLRIIKLWENKAIG